MAIQQDSSEGQNNINTNATESGTVSQGSETVTTQGGEGNSEGQGLGQEGQGSQEGTSSLLGDLHSQNNGNQDDTKDGQNDKGKAEEGNGDDKPIEYGEFKIPEGFEVPEELANEFVELAKQAKMPKEIAQKFVDYQIKAVQQSHDLIERDYSDQIQQMKKETAEYIGTGEQAKERNANVARFMKHVPKEAIALLNQTGLGNNKHIYQIFEKAGAMIGEDSFHNGKNSGSSNKTEGELFYPQMK